MEPGSTHLHHRRPGPRPAGTTPGLPTPADKSRTGAGIGIKAPAKNPAPDPDTRWHGRADRPHTSPGRDSQRPTQALQGPTTRHSHPHNHHQQPEPGASRTPAAEDHWTFSRKPSQQSSDSYLHTPHDKSQYTSQRFLEHLETHDIRPSLGRTGVCWDNTWEESFNAALKNDERTRRMAYPTTRKEISDIASRIEPRRNHICFQSALGYHVPNKVERKLPGLSRTA